MQGMTVSGLLLAHLAMAPANQSVPPAASLAQDAEVTALAYSPDARLLAVGTKQSTITLWDVRKRQKLSVLSGTVGAVLALAFSPNGAALASIGASDEKARLWDPATGRAVRSLSLFEIDGVSQGFTALAFTPNSATVVLGEGGGKVTLWDAATGGHRRMLPPHDSVVTAVAVTPDGATVLSADLERRVRIRPIDPKARAESLGTIGEGFTGLAIAPDGTTVALGGSEKTSGRSPKSFPVEIWDLRTRKRLSTLQGHRSPTNALAFATGGRLIVSAATDGTVSVWNASTGKLLLGSSGAAFAVSATSLAIGEARTVKIVPLPKAT